MADHPAPWLEDILRTAGDISSATAARIRHAAEYGYHLSHSGEAWAQWAARHQAKIALTSLATESDPAVSTARRAYSEAREHAESLSKAATGPDGNHKDILTPEGLAFYLADHAAGAAHEAYVEVYRAASQRYEGQVSQAWRGPDIGFLRSHQSELQAADPESFKNILATFGEDSGAREYLPTSPGPGAGQGHASATLITGRPPDPYEAGDVVEYRPTGETWTVRDYVPPGSAHGEIVTLDGDSGEGISTDPRNLRLITKWFERGSDPADGWPEWPGVSLHGQHQAETRNLPAAIVEEAAPPGLAAGPDFPEAAAARLTASPSRHPPGSVIASPARQTRPGRLG